VLLSISAGHGNETAPLHWPDNIDEPAGTLDIVARPNPVPQARTSRTAVRPSVRLSVSCLLAMNFKMRVAGLHGSKVLSIANILESKVIHYRSKL